MKGNGKKEIVWYNYVEDHTLNKNKWFQIVVYYLPLFSNSSKKKRIDVAKYTLPCMHETIYRESLKKPTRTTTTTTYYLNACTPQNL